MIRLLNDDFTVLADMENASDVFVTEVLNGVGSLSFSLPYDDAKREYIHPFRLVELLDENGAREDMFRILPARRSSERGGGRIVVDCEHVFASLLDDVMPGWRQYGGTGLYTADAIRYVLSFQLKKNWILGNCEFTDQYEYGWEHEKCLTALNGIAATVSDYKWEFDVSQYPWVLHFRRININKEPEYRIAYGYNREAISKAVDPTNLITRVYAYGYGEGINQLNIADVNGGHLYLDAPTIPEYGVKCGYYINRAVEDAQTLKAEAQAVLDMACKPKITYTVKALDLFEITGSEMDRPRAGKIAKVFDEDFGEEFTTYITKAARQIGGQNSVEILMSNIPDDIADAITQIADRQRIERSYAQGATQIYMVSVQDNASPGKPLRVNFFAPSELRAINEVRAKITLSSFRSYSQATEINAQLGSTSQQAQLWVTTQPEIVINLETFGPEGSTATHIHTVRPFGADVNAYIEPHAHDFTLPAHSHAITAGIFESGSPSSATVSVMGKNIGSVGRDGEIDITQYLVTTNNMIPRGTWLHMDINPNSLAYISVSLFFQGFIQSRGGGRY